MITASVIITVFYCNSVKNFCITFLAAGAAADPPKPACSIMTLIAICGSSYGAKPINSACVFDEFFLSLAVSAFSLVPVFPQTQFRLSALHCPYRFLQHQASCPLFSALFPYPSRALYFCLLRNKPV